MKAKIYCFINHEPNCKLNDVVAIAEDGNVLACHISSNEAWAKHDIGLTSDRKHEAYKEHYPSGYELVWVENPLENGELSKAFEKHHTLEGEVQEEGC